MKISITGLPNSGKTTLFNALTRSEAPVASYSDSRAEPHLGEVEVIDERITRLSKLYNPEKTTYAKIEMIDFAGVSKGAAREGPLSGELLRLIKSTDALAVVLRNFSDDNAGVPDPGIDLSTITGEFLLSDMVITENRLEKIEAGFKRGIKTNELQIEQSVLRKIHAHLEEMKPVRNLELSDTELKAIKGFQFLTLKPLLVIVNSSEELFGKNASLMASLSQSYTAIEFAGNFEMELSRLTDQEEIRLFMDDMGINESARDRLSQAAYSLLGYISFFTVGDDEVRAWTIRQGDTALLAAGAIHSDLMRGFIRAECFSYDDLRDAGSEKAVKEKGKFRLEGKNYIVKDGDILSIRFNV
ncbi:MAG: redox-regulated ATPase YchF [Chitinivibrionales bacterium]|nr:redox-regulated ATPase YchF [Chitinivibrionales bacterium]